MKISIVIPSFYPATIYGGPIFSSLNTIKELVKIKDTQVWVSTTNANMTKKLDVNSNTWISFESNFYVKYYNETKINFISVSLLFSLWKDLINKDIVHAQYIFSTPTPISILYAFLLKKPIILSPRGALCHWCLAQGSSYKSLWLSVFIKPFIKHIYWHATAQQEKDEILALFPTAKIKIIPNGIEYKRYQNINKLTVSEYTKKFIKQKIVASNIIISMGRLQKKKGFDILIDAFNDVLKTKSDAILLIAGEDEGEKENLLQQIKNLSLETKIFLIGNIDNQDKIDFFANADLFVLASHNENFGNVYIESLASGTPIVATKGTPWKEVNEYNCGQWVNNTTEELGKAMIMVLKQDKKLMQYNAKRLAKKYDWSIIAKEFLNYYTSVCQTNC